MLDRGKACGHASKKLGAACATPTAKRPDGERGRYETASHASSKSFVLNLPSTISPGAATEKETTLSDYFELRKSIYSLGHTK